MVYEAQMPTASEITLPPIECKPTSWETRLKNAESFFRHVGLLRNTITQAQSITKTFGGSLFSLVNKKFQNSFLNKYILLNTALAKGDIKQIEEMTSLKLYKSYAKELNARSKLPADFRFKYHLKKPKVNLLHLGHIPATEYSLGQVAVRIRGEQVAYVTGKDGKIVAGSAEPKPIDEQVDFFFYMVRSEVEEVENSPDKAKSKLPLIKWRINHKKKFIYYDENLNPIIPKEPNQIPAANQKQQQQQSQKQSQP